MTDAEPLPPLPEPELEESEDSPLITTANLRRAFLWGLMQGLLGGALTALLILGEYLVSLLGDSGAVAELNMLRQVAQVFLGSFVAVPVCFVFIKGQGTLGTRGWALKCALVAWAVAAIAVCVEMVSASYLNEMISEGTPLAGIQGVMKMGEQGAVRMLFSLGWVISGSLVYALLVFARLRAWPLLAQIALLPTLNFPLSFGLLLGFFEYHELPIPPELVWGIGTSMALRSVAVGTAMAVGWRLADALDERLAKRAT